MTIQKRNKADKAKIKPKKEIEQERKALQRNEWRKRQKTSYLHKYGNENKGNKQNRIKYLWAKANDIDFEGSKTSFSSQLLKS